MYFIVHVKLQVSKLWLVYKVTNHVNVGSKFILVLQAWALIHGIYILNGVLSTRSLTRLSHMHKCAVSFKYFCVKNILISLINGKFKLILLRNSSVIYWMTVTSIGYQLSSWCGFCFTRFIIRNGDKSLNKKSWPMMKSIMAVKFVHNHLKYVQWLNADHLGMVLKLTACLAV